jgi:hypothetical protein
MLKSGCLSMIEHTKMGDMGNESDKAPDAIAEFQERRRAFDRLCNQLWNPNGKPYEVFIRCACPACGYPTIGERSRYDMCYLCMWEDDGQDDDSADEVWGGPNGDYSLTEARQNFSRFDSMYRPDDISGSEWANKDLAAKNKIRKMYDSLPTISDSKKLAEQILAVKRLEGSPTTLEEYLSRKPLRYDQRKGVVLDDWWLAHPVWEGTPYQYGRVTRDSALRYSLQRLSRMEDHCKRLRGKIPGFNRCPCAACGFPTVRIGDPRCLLCDWQQNVSASDTSGSAEKPLHIEYTLTEARINFEKYLTTYCPEDEPKFSRSQKNLLKKCLLIRAYLELSAGSFQVENLVSRILDLEKQILAEREGKDCHRNDSYPPKG